MKKIIYGIALFATAMLGTNASAGDCLIHYSTANEILDKAMERNNGFDLPRYDEICRKLQNKNAALFIAGDATVLSGRSISWAAAFVRDKDTTITTPSWSGTSTNTDSNASIEVAHKMAYKSINSAVSNIDIDKAIAALDKERASMRAALKK